MSQAGSYLFGGVLFAGLLGMTAIASREVGSADQEAAVAAAIRTLLADYVGKDTIEGTGEITGPLYLWLTREVELDTKKIASELVSTVIRPIPVEDCASRRVEGDFGMLTAMTYHFAPNGEEAGHMTVADIKCSGPARCIVDLDMVGSGDRYSVQRSGTKWRVVAHRNRWIV